MAKRVYIGSSNSSKRIKNMYVGVSGASRRVIKGYIGVSGTAKQFYPAYAWNKYSVKTTTTYSETRGGEVTIDRGRSTGGYTRWSCYTSYSFNQNNGQYSYSGSANVECRPGTSYVSSRYYNGYEVTSTYGYRREEAGGAHWVYYSELRGKQMGASATTTEGPGTRVGFVMSNESNTYPSNGKHTDGYWYIRI